jgi:hypothetical protein
MTVNVHIATNLRGSRRGAGHGAGWRLRCRAQQTCAQKKGNDKETTKVQGRHNTSSRVSLERTTRIALCGFYLSSGVEFHNAVDSLLQRAIVRHRQVYVFMHGDENGPTPLFALEINSESSVPNRCRASLLCPLKDS